MAVHIDELIKDVREESRLREKLYYESLMAQINPHFLYNSLNSIKWISTLNGNTLAADMLGKLGNILHYSFDSNQYSISVGKEIAFLNDYVAMLQLRYGNSIDFSVDIDPSLCSATIPRFCLQPLIENAFMHGLFSRPDGRITLCAAVEGNQLTLTVADDGVGMDEQTAALALSGDHGRKISGTGIGLPNVHNRIQLLYGASLWIAHRQQTRRGLPDRCGVALNERACLRRVCSPGVQVFPALSGDEMIRVLIVEDEYLVRVGLHTCIDWEAQGFALLSDATDGMDALAKIGALKPDIVLLDLRMPRMSGLELLEKLQRQNISVSVIVLSCCDDFESVRTALRYGVIDYVNKLTMTPDELLTVLKRSASRLQVRSDSATGDELPDTGTKAALAALIKSPGRFAGALPEGFETGRLCSCGSTRKRPGGIPERAQKHDSAGAQKRRRRKRGLRKRGRAVGHAARRRGPSAYRGIAAPGA